MEVMGRPAYEGHGGDPPGKASASGARVSVAEVATAVVTVEAAPQPWAYRSPVPVVCTALHELHASHVQALPT